MRSFQRILGRDEFKTYLGATVRDVLERARDSIARARKE